MLYKRRCRRYRLVEFVEPLSARALFWLHSVISRWPIGPPQPHRPPTTANNNMIRRFHSLRLWFLSSHPLALSCRTAQSSAALYPTASRWPARCMRRAQHLCTNTVAPQPPVLQLSGSVVAARSTWVNAVLSVFDIGAQPGVDAHGISHNTANAPTSQESRFTLPRPENRSLAPKPGTRHSLRRQDGKTDVSEGCARCGDPSGTRAPSVPKQ